MPYIYGTDGFKMQNFPPVASVAKPLVELVTLSPWPGGPKFKPQLNLMMSLINDRDPGFNPRGGEMHQPVPMWSFFGWQQAVLLAAKPPPEPWWLPSHCDGNSYW